ncbi:phage tail tape measure C-terminal domain-containing protein [Ancylobacter mangrovi]|uniref:phage tail tape measure C-terminal domain-containing protein n=1 Tax=Ancylobacter mangrovi TaxID=2972472 RepID=UPI002163CE5F|nr:phage tail tape measure C-terminal domain-containing protein [Ancylobacter mangrovi]MCS0501377.1 phage tail length tape measure family protein [Ancylobacter mangrovi]
MAERNVGIRLQVLDGGKVKAELSAVGDAGAKALDQMKDKSQQAAGAVNQLRTHEITNLSAQLTDLGVQVLSGQSFATAMIQQGPQIAAVLGDRGVKGALKGVSTALLSLVTPTSIILAGIVALGYGASFVFSALTDDVDDAGEALKRHEDLVRRLTDRYGEFDAATRSVSEGQRALDTALAAKNVEAMRALYQRDLSDFDTAMSRRAVSVGTAGDIAQSPLFEPFAEAAKRLAQTAREGLPDIAAFRQEVARLANETDNPAVKQMGYDLLDLSEAAAASGDKFEEARRALDHLATSLGISQQAAKDFKAAMKDWDFNQRLIDSLDRRTTTADDPRQQAIDAELARLKNPTPEQREQATARAGALYDAEHRQREQEKRDREALSDARRQQNELEAEARRIYDDTRTAAETYADTLARLDKLLGAGKITQDTYNRAVVDAGKAMAAANRAALDDATDAASGYRRAVLDYAKSAQDTANAIEGAFVDAVGGAEDAFVDFVTTGKADFSDLVDSMIADLARLTFRQAFAPVLTGTSDAVSSFLGSLFGGAGFAGGKASGGDVRMGFDYLVGETGPELFRPKQDGAIIPTKALASAGTAPRVTVNLSTPPGTTADVGEPRTDTNGGFSLDIVVRAVKRELISDLEQRGDHSRALEARYGLNAAKGMY